MRIWILIAVVSQKYSLWGRLLRAVLFSRGATVVHLHAPGARGDLALVRDTRACTDLLVEDAAAFEILAYVRAARRLGGAMAELGVFGGGTARLICEAKGDVPLHLFDVFETLQEPTAVSDRGDRAGAVHAHFGTWHTPRATVERVLAPYPGVHIHAGTFPDTTSGLEQERFCFVHLDADMETSTGDALQFFFPRMVPGGVIIGDDYNMPAVRRAFDQFFESLPGAIIALPWGQVVAIKVAA
jgi:hypothetical protein